MTKKKEDHWTPGVRLGLGLMVLVFLVMAVTRPLGIWPSWIVVMLAVAGFIIFAGKGIKGVWLGALIDERNKMSLSRFQMLTWTVVTLSAYGTVVIARVPKDPLTALDVAIPATLWLLMGISTTSLVGSPLIKSTKKESSLALKDDEWRKRLEDEGQDPDSVRVEGLVVSNRDAKDARLGDLLTGEEVPNLTHLDLAKIQMFFFTILLVLAYSVAIGSMLRHLAPGEVPSGLPEVGEGMLALLGISHGGYLANKAVPTAKSQRATI